MRDTVPQMFLSTPGSRMQQAAFALLLVAAFCKTGRQLQQGNAVHQGPVLPAQTLPESQACFCALILPLECRRQRQCPAWL